MPMPLLTNGKSPEKINSPVAVPRTTVRGTETRTAMSILSLIVLLPAQTNVQAATGNATAMVTGLAAITIPTVVRNGELSTIAIQARHAPADIAAAPAKAPTLMPVPIWTLTATNQ